MSGVVWCGAVWCAWLLRVPAVGVCTLLSVWGLADECLPSIRKRSHEGSLQGRTSQQRSIDRQPIVRVSGCALTAPVPRCCVGSVPGNVSFVRADIVSWQPPPSLHRSVDCVLSDVMSRTTGVADIDVQSSAALVRRVLALSVWLCRPSASVLAKVFSSAHVDGLMEQFRAHFTSVRLCKPAASRKESREMYILASNKHQTSVP